MVVSPGKVVSKAPCAQPKLDGFVFRLASEQAVNKAGGKAIAAADAVIDIKFHGGRLMR